MVIPNRDLSEPAFGQFFVKLGQLIALLSDKILQLLDALHLDVLGSFIGIRLLLQLSQEENLLRNIVMVADFMEAPTDNPYTILPN